jgi:holo-[acyl-carrier protein] synthase
VRMRMNRRIFGIGTDIIEIERFEHLIEKNDTFLKRYYTQEEQEMIRQRPHPAKTMAINFAGKEALTKALGTGISSQVRLEDIGILRHASGAPYIKLEEKTRHFVALQGVCDMYISLSDTKTCAMAYVVLEQEDCDREKKM